MKRSCTWLPRAGASSSSSVSFSIQERWLTLVFSRFSQVPPSIEAWTVQVSPPGLTPVSFVYQRQ